jgi:lipopolysaccharide/colanic/teichoic acid biosynthesis glycosyltransferase
MPRFLDLFLSALLLVFALPMLGAIAIAIWCDDGLPVLYRQQRVGRQGALFTLWKFRSMTSGVVGPSITSGRDPRITRVGRYLRKYKLDELPQLWNVLRGEMSFIGPRPETPEYVDRTNEVWARIHGVKPGITSLATLIYRNEEALLMQYPNPELAYRDVILPEKLSLNIEYLNRRSLRSDLRLLFLTMYYSVCAGRFNPKTIKTSVLGG